MITSELAGLVSIAEVAEALDVSELTVRRWSAAGKFPAPRRLSKRTLRWTAAEVNQWVDTQNAQNASQARSVAHAS